MRRPAPQEGNVQDAVKKRILKEFPGAHVCKTDPNLWGWQGVPDLLIIYKDKWAFLEMKRHKDAARQANQDYWVRTLDKQGCAAFCYPEVREQAFKKLHEYFD